MEWGPILHCVIWLFNFDCLIWKCFTLKNFRKHHTLNHVTKRKTVVQALWHNLIGRHMKFNSYHDIQINLFKRYFDIDIDEFFHGLSLFNPIQTGGISLIPPRVIPPLLQGVHFSSIKITEYNLRNFSFEHMRSSFGIERKYYIKLWNSITVMMLLNSSLPKQTFFESKVTYYLQEYSFIEIKVLSSNFQYCSNHVSPFFQKKFQNPTTCIGKDFIFHLACGLQLFF